MLVTAALMCPLLAFGDDASVAHRVNIDGLPMREWETADGVTARCGAKVKLYSVDGSRPVEWSALRTRGTTIRRCPTCRAKAGPT